jgi:hypothetical protein
VETSRAVRPPRDQPAHLFVPLIVVDRCAAPTGTIRTVAASTSAAAAAAAAAATTTTRLLGSGLCFTLLGFGGSCSLESCSSGLGRGDGFR